MEKRSKFSIFVNIIFTIIVLALMAYVYNFYKVNFFNEFTKAETILGTSKFTKDKEENYSYKIESEEYNDAIFYKKIKVNPNTPYKLSCMVKTKDVESENKKPGSGAQIAVLDTTECSKSILGTNDWQKLEFIFDSKDREEIEIGFRLGGNDSNSKGTAWFSDFKLEEGTKDDNTNWNVACFIMENVDVVIDEKNVKLSMSRSDIDAMIDNMERFKKSMAELSNNKMTVDYDIYEIYDAVKTVTYSDEFAYYLDPQDVYVLIKDYLEKEEYDYIFVAVRLGDDFEDVRIEVNDWIGLRVNGLKWNWIFKY